METFIVRIYRKGNGSPDTISGLVEEVEKEKTRGFATKDELWSIINPDERRDDVRKEGAGKRVIEGDVNYGNE